MFEDLKKSVLLKTMLVILIGLFALDQLLNLISGGGSMNHNSMASGNMMGGYNYSFGGLLSSVLMLLVNLFMILLVVVVILGIIAWVRETFFKGGTIQLPKALGNDPLIKSVTVITLAILGLVLIAALFNGMMNPGYGGRGGNLFYGFNPVLSIVGVLSLLIRLLTFVLIISLILAVIIYLKNQYESGKLNFFGEAKDNTTAATLNVSTVNTTNTAAANDPASRPGNNK